MAYGWKDEEYALRLSLKDLAKLVRLPGKLDEYYVSELTCSDTKKGISTAKDDQDDFVVCINFSRLVTHKVKETR